MDKDETMRLTALDKDETIRLTALDRAMAANVGQEYDDMGFIVTSADKILEAAKKFEAYLKGETNV